MPVVASKYPPPSRCYSLIGVVFIWVLSKWRAWSCKKWGSYLVTKDPPTILGSSLCPTINTKVSIWISAPKPELLFGRTGIAIEFGGHSSWCKPVICKQNSKNTRGLKNIQTSKLKPLASAADIPAAAAATERSLNLPAKLWPSSFLSEDWLLLEGMAP